MGNGKVLLGGILAAVALVALAGYAFAYYPYMYQNSMNNGGQCPGRMMGGNMGGMMGMGNHMSGMQCPYHQNGNYNSTNRIAIANYAFQVPDSSISGFSTTCRATATPSQPLAPTPTTAPHTPP